MVLPVYWYKGHLHRAETIALALDDPGLLYGASLFTTLRVVNGNLAHPATAWPAHCDRLAASGRALGWAQPDWGRLTLGARTLLAEAPEARILRLAVFADGREWIVGRVLPEDLGDRYRHGILAHWDAAGQELYRRSLPQHKSGNYLPCWLAHRSARQHSAQEAILSDRAGHWLETSTGNLWAYRAGQWWTPPLGKILPGIARQRLGSHLAAAGEPVGEAPWTADWVGGCEAIAYSNSVVGLVAIRAVVGPGAIASAAWASDSSLARVAALRSRVWPEF